MILSKSILMMVLDVYPDWGHSPERFAEFIRVVMGCWKSHGESIGYDSFGSMGTEKELGEIFLRVFKEVDLKPYTSFDQLLEKTQDGFNLLAAIEKMKMEIEAEEEFFKLIMSGVATQDVGSILEETFKEYRSEDIVCRLSSYIDFHE